MNQYPTIDISSSVPSAQRGAVLLEAMIAILLFSVGMLALAGLQTAMIKNTDDAKYRAEASFVAQNKISEIFLNTEGKATAGGYNVTDDPYPDLPNGLVTVDVAAGTGACGLVNVTVNWSLPGGNVHAYSTSAPIKGNDLCV